MAHYAKVKDGVVVDVIVAEASYFDDFVDNSPGEWIQTSYNTYGNAHKQGGTPLRANYAGIGFTYDKTADVFIPPKPLNGGTWIIDTNTYLWKRPVDYPTDGQSYRWDENSYQNDNTTGWVVKSSEE